MRPSKRQQVLDAACSVVRSEGLTAVTYESVAHAAGMTRAGVAYHFASREDLVDGLHEHLAASWEAEMERSAGAECAELDSRQRREAYVDVASRSSSRVELQFLLEGSSTPRHSRIWSRVLERWADGPPGPDEDQAAYERFIARLAADGLWMHESWTGQVIDPRTKQRVADALKEVMGEVTEPGGVAGTGREGTR